jgi:hypothetical protein
MNMNPKTILIIDVQNGFIKEPTRSLPAKIAAYLEKRGV